MWQRAQLRTSRIAAALGVCLAAVSVVSMAPTSASAASTCKGSTCTGKNPETYGCSSGATVIDSMKLTWGHFELRYSTRCAAGWVRYTATKGGDHEAWGTVEGGYVERGTFHEQTKYKGTPTYGTDWTKMIAGSYTLKLCGETDSSSDPFTCKSA